MRKLFLSFLAILIVATLQAQIISGNLKNEEGEPLPGAVISFTKGFTQSVVTDNQGDFSYKATQNGIYKVEVSFVGYEKNRLKIIVNDTDQEISIILKTMDFLTDDVVVNGQFAQKNTPVAFTNVNKEAINKGNLGMDIPYLLQLTPSVTVSSDAGAGIGYTAMRVRGTDISRINVTLDGIPLNDAESHNVYWVDLPDYTSSVNMIQIQRGVGTSTSGAAAFGANIKFKTNALEKKPYGEANFTGGSFKTLKSTFKAGTGVLKKHFTFDARLSKINSDGYIDRASSDLKSYFASAAYFNKKNLLRINLTSGLEETYQAWYGVPKDSLKTKTGRTYNPYSYDNEIDHYGQKHLQLFYTHEINKNMNLNLTLFQTKGAGYYEQYKTGRKLKDYGMDTLFIGSDTIAKSDLIQRKWLDNTFRGGIATVNYANKVLHISAGAGYNTYDGNHFGKVIWMRNAGNNEIRKEWYRSNSLKTDANAYLTANYNLINNLNIWADVQYRAINYDIKGIDDNGRDITQNNKYNFLNPKAGLNYDISKIMQAYFSFAVANREPKRSDLTDVAPEKRPSAETLNDFELGYKLTSPLYAFDLNLYYMDYKNQLVQTGEINQVGDAAMVNVDKSYRAGIEIAAGVQLFNRVNWNANATFSQNKIKKSTQYVDNWDTWRQDSLALGQTDISFSPNFIFANNIEVLIVKGLSINLMTKYVSAQFIDNTSSKARMLDAYLVNNIRLNYSFSPAFTQKIDLFFAVNNVLNEEYETNAWVYRYSAGGVESAMFGFFPQAKMNFLGGINIRF